MGYKIVHSNSMGSGSARGATATEALAKINELRRTGSMVGPIIDEAAGEPIGELTLEDRAEAESA